MVKTDKSPDGGWGWVVVGASLFCFSLWSAAQRCYAPFYDPLRREFGVDYETVSWLNGLYQMGYGVGCFLVPVLYKHVSYRRGVICGGIVATCSTLLSSFADQLWQVQACCGVITGLCMSALVIGSISSVTRYFDRYRVSAVQMVCAGCSLGVFAYCPLFQFLIENYGWRGTLQITSGIILNSCVAGALLRPITLQNGNCSSTESARPRLSTASNSTDEASVSDNQHSGCCKVSFSKLCRRDTVSRIIDHWDLRLFIRADFYFYLFGWFCFALAYQSALIFLVPFGIKVGFGSIASAALLSFVAFGELGSRLLYGLLYHRIKKQYAYTFVVIVKLVAAACCFTLYWLKSYPAVAFICVLLGVLVGGVDAVYCNVLVDLFGIDLYSSAYGYSNLVTNLLGTAGTVALGAVADLTGNIASPFVVGCGSLICSSFFMLGMNRLVQAR